MTHLQDLILNGNRLGTIPSGLGQLRFLKTLDLGKNHIESVANSSFEGLDLLYGLRLVDNHIVNISRDAFSTLPSLQMEWLLNINRLSNLRHYPQVLDMDAVMCELAHKGPTAQPLLSSAFNFLCPYETLLHGCHCCDFDACDCEMTCQIDVLVSTI
nr:unnamed protein product [Callosobruchus chinensis]